MSKLKKNDKELDALLQKAAFEALHDLDILIQSHRDKIEELEDDKTPDESIESKSENKLKVAWVNKKENKQK